MQKDYVAISQRISGNMKTLRQDIPETMRDSHLWLRLHLKDGALDKKTKELIVLAIGVATRCDGCIGFHAEALVKFGATKAEVEEVLGMTIYMGGGSYLMYAADAIAAFEQFSV